MLTPIEIQARTFKAGIGYEKKDVEAFMREVLESYETLYKRNVELQDKVSTLTEGVQYYKSIESTLQNALILAEKTSSETKEAAHKQARAIEHQARIEAESIVAESKNELNRIHVQTVQLLQQYEKYKVQFKQLAISQLEMLKSECFEIDVANLEAFLAKDNTQQVQEDMNEDLLEERKKAQEEAEMLQNIFSSSNKNKIEEEDLEEEEKVQEIQQIEEKKVREIEIPFRESSQLDKINTVRKEEPNLEQEKKRLLFQRKGKRKETAFLKESPQEIYEEKANDYFKVKPQKQVQEEEEETSDFVEKSKKTMIRHTETIDEIIRSIQNELKEDKRAQEIEDNNEEFEFSGLDD